MFSAVVLEAGGVVEFGDDCCAGDYQGGFVVGRGDWEEGCEEGEREGVVT